MGHIQDGIEKAIEETGAQAILLSKGETALLWTDVDNRFAAPAPGAALWERLLDASYCRDESGWRRVSGFRPDDPCILFAPPHLESRAFAFEHARDVARVLAECPRFVSYVVGRDLEYLVCFDDHDCVRAVGTAKAWLASRCAK